VIPLFLWLSSDPLSTRAKHVVQLRRCTTGFFWCVVYTIKPPAPNWLCTAINHCWTESGVMVQLRILLPQPPHAGCCLVAVHLVLSSPQLAVSARGRTRHRESASGRCYLAHSPCLTYARMLCHGTVPPPGATLCCHCLLETLVRKPGIPAIPSPSGSPPHLVHLPLEQLILTASQAQLTLGTLDTLPRAVQLIKGALQKQQNSEANSRLHCSGLIPFRHITQCSLLCGTAPGTHSPAAASVLL
jgi:hypothetical protein